MPSGPDDDDRPDQDRPSGGRGPGRPRSDRARRADDDRRTGGPRRAGRPGEGGDRTGGRPGRPSTGRGGAGRPGDRDRSGSGRPGDRDRSGSGRPSDRGRGGGRGGERDRTGSGRPGDRDRARPGRPGDRDRSPRGGDRRDDRGDRPRRDEERGPRPPIKGKRRTFDVDSAPNERERRRLEGTEEPKAGERWIDEGPVRRAADDAVQRGSRSRPPATRAPSESSGSSRSTQRRAQRAAKRAEGALEIDKDRLRRRLGAARAERTIGRIGEAAAAYAEDRFEDARKTLKPIAELIPEEPAVRELHGLSLYRLGRWRKAADELEEFARLSGSTEQHPVLADCYRALGQHERVEELWEEIGEASLAAPLVAEGRIVYAGSLADQGRLVDAIAVLEAGALGDKGLKDHHLRMRYVLGDLNDRAGEHQAARRWFESIASSAPDFFDVRERLRQL